MSTGGNEVVEINEDVSGPAVSKGHLLIEVHAAGVNPIDWKICEGYMSQMVPLKFPATLGGDISGIVTEVGKHACILGSAKILGQCRIGAKNIGTHHTIKAPFGRYRFLGLQSSSGPSKTHEPLFDFCTGIFYGER